MLEVSKQDLASCSSANPRQQNVNRRWRPLALKSASAAELHPGARLNMRPINIWEEQRQLSFRLTMTQHTRKMNEVHSSIHLCFNVLSRFRDRDFSLFNFVFVFSRKDT